MWDVCPVCQCSLDSSHAAYAWNQPTFSRYVLQKCSRSATVAPPSRFSAAHSSSRKWRYAPVARCSGVPESQNNCGRIAPNCAELRACLLGRAGEREQLLHALDVPKQLVEVVVHYTFRDRHLHEG